MGNFQSFWEGRGSQKEVNDSKNDISWAPKSASYSAEEGSCDLNFSGSMVGTAEEITGAPSRSDDEGPSALPHHQASNSTSNLENLPCNGASSNAKEIQEWGKWDESGLAPVDLGFAASKEGQDESEDEINPEDWICDDCKTIINKVAREAENSSTKSRSSFFPIFKPSKRRRLSCAAPIATAEGSGWPRATFYNERGQRRSWRIAHSRSGAI
jgi:hypothetical protein